LKRGGLTGRIVQRQHASVLVDAREDWRALTLDLLTDSDHAARIELGTDVHENETRQLLRVTSGKAGGDPSAHGEADQNQTLDFEMRQDPF
jgi:hypothetical protein